MADSASKPTNKSGQKPRFEIPASWTVEIGKIQKRRRLLMMAGTIASFTIYFLLLQSHSFAPSYIRTAQGLVCLPALLIGSVLMALYRRYNEDVDRSVLEAFPGIRKDSSVRAVAARFLPVPPSPQTIRRYCGFHRVFSVMAGYIVACQLAWLFGPTAPPLTQDVLRPSNSTLVAAPQGAK